MKKPRQNVFKKPEAYSSSSSVEVSSEECVERPFEEVFIEQFFEAFFAFITDECSMVELKQQFTAMQDRLEQANLPQKTKAQLLRSIDHYIGRMKTNIDSIVREWYNASIK